MEVQVGEFLRISCHVDWYPEDVFELLLCRCVSVGTKHYPGSERLPIQSDINDLLFHQRQIIM